jgi:hypothetical protein
MHLSQSFSVLNNDQLNHMYDRRQYEVLLDLWYEDDVMCHIEDRHGHHQIKDLKYE